MGATNRPATKAWRHKALRLYLAGLSYSQIAEALGKQADSVRKGIDAELADETENYAEHIKRDRAVKCAQLDAILRGNLPKATSGDINSSFVCIAVIKEQVRIKGLASAEKIDVNAKLSLSFDAHQALLERIAKYVEK
jgi:hypothetical protein